MKTCQENQENQTRQTCADTKNGGQVGIEIRFGDGRPEPAKGEVANHQAQSLHGEENRLHRSFEVFGDLAVEVNLAGDQEIGDDQTIEQ